MGEVSLTTSITHPSLGRSRVGHRIRFIVMDADPSPPQFMEEFALRNTGNLRCLPQGHPSIDEQSQGEVQLDIFRRESPFDFVWQHYGHQVAPRSSCRRQR